MDRREGSGNKWNRHTLIWVTPEGRQYAAEHIVSWQWEEDTPESMAWKRLLVQDVEVPGIICRQPEQEEGFWLAGFSHWEYRNGSRMRMQAYVPEETVWKSCSPFELCREGERERLCEKYPELKPVFEAAGGFGVEVGLYGSTALEWVTKRPYRNQGSDFDLYVRAGQEEGLQGFGRELQRMEKDQGVCFDVEAEIKGFGVKLKEFLERRKTFLGKGLYEVRLLGAEDVIKD
ncbi:hypothetical protein D3Z51_17900 [Clostridiaceae bacterium]|nr:hypothetical protein [Clostridiaceae bacterium]RKI09446.1 hypothetical protein D7V81_17480 [bacterium 1XD21-70]